MIWQKRWFQLTILLILAFVWGSSFILMKIGMMSFDSNQAAALRILMASLALMPVALSQIKNLHKKDVPTLLIVGFIGSFFPAFLFMKAETRIDSSVAGMLNSLTPVFTLIVGLLFHRTGFRWSQVLGLILGLSGAAGLLLAGSDLHNLSINSYALYIVLATFFYAINLNQIKSRLPHLTGIQVTSFSFMFIGPAALAYLLINGFTPHVYNPSWPLHLLALAALGVLGTAAAMLLMNSLIRYSSAVGVSSVTYVIPVFAIMWGVIFGEKITLLHIFCMGLILLGVYIINWKKRAVSN